MKSPFIAMGGAFSPPGPKEPFTQVPAIPARGGAAPPAAVRPFPAPQEHAFTCNSPGHTRAFPAAPRSQRQPEARPKRSTRRLRRLTAPAGMAAPAKQGLAGGSSPRCPQPPAAYGDALLCRRPRQHSASSSRGVTSRPSGIGTSAPRRLPASAAAAPAPSPTARAAGPSRPGAGGLQGGQGGGGRRLWGPSRAASARAER